MFLNFYGKLSKVKYDCCALAYIDFGHVNDRKT